ncbi:MAG TPA: hypothetical protein VM243_02050 [Phycisphaerae bacterium]|nr:hypothetical protein [Phycisphaerae bacterium]
MPRYTCSCGARYKLPDNAVGKKAKCRRCGAVFTVPVGGPAVAEPAENDGRRGRAGGAQTAIPVARLVAPAVKETAADYTPDQLLAMGRADLTGDKPNRGFWADVGWSLLLFTDLNNLIMIMVIWFLYAIDPIVSSAPFIGFWGHLIIFGWLCSYWFKVIVESAGGEDQLPTLSLSEGWLDDVIFPLLKFLGATLLAWVPAIVCTLAVAMHLGKDFFDVAGNPTVLVYTLIGVVMFLWPMVLLVVAIGGFSSVWRGDLIVRTIARTAPAYLTICVLSTGAALLWGNADRLTSRLTGGGLSSGWLSGVIAALIQAYSAIVGMWIVGLYYHHFKHRFAWSWG